MSLDLREQLQSTLGSAVRQPDGWLQMYNRSERYESLRRDSRRKAALESIERW